MFQLIMNCLFVVVVAYSGKFILWLGINLPVVQNNLISTKQVVTILSMQWSWVHHTFGFIGQLCMPC